jgi:hypothetical protein
MIRVVSKEVQAEQQKRIEELEGIVRELSKSPLRIDDPSFGHMAAVQMDLIDRAKEAMK